MGKCDMTQTLAQSEYDPNSHVSVEVRQAVTPHFDYMELQLCVNCRILK